MDQAEESLTRAGAFRVEVSTDPHFPGPFREKEPLSMFEVVEGQLTLPPPPEFYMEDVRPTTMARDTGVVGTWPISQTC